MQIPDEGVYRISFSGVVVGDDENNALLALQDLDHNNLALAEMG